MMVRGKKGGGEKGGSLFELADSFEITHPKLEIVH